MELSPGELQELTLLEERLWIADFRFDRSWMETVQSDDFSNSAGRDVRIPARNA